MPISEDARLDCIRHLEYEVLGLYQLSPAGGSNAYGNAGIRMFGAYGDLLFKLNWLRPIEEAKLTGLATGWIAFNGQDPTPGDSITITLSAAILMSPIVVTVTVPPLVPGASPWGLNTFAQALSSAFAQNAAFYQNGFNAVADYGQNPLSQQRVAVPVCSVNAPAGVGSFTLAMTYTGTTAPYVTQTAVPVAPFISFRQQGAVQQIFGYLPIMNFLDGAYGGETVTLSASEANGTKFRGDVLERREEQVDRYRKQLSNFLGVPINRLAPSRSPMVGY